MTKNLIEPKERDFRDLIEEFPGAHTKEKIIGAAAMLHIPYSALKAAQYRNCIPPWHWQKIISAFDSMGKTLTIEDIYWACYPQGDNSRSKIARERERLKKKRLAMAA